MPLNCAPQSCHLSLSAGTSPKLEPLQEDGQGQNFFFLGACLRGVCAFVCGSTCVQVHVHSSLGEPKVDTGLFLHIPPPDVMSQSLSMLVWLAS